MLERQFLIKDKQKARQFFYGLRQAFIDWNYAPWDTQQFKQQQEKIESLLKEESYAKSMH